MMNPAVSRLRSEVVEPLKRRFVGRDEVVDLIALAVTAGEHLFLHGPPGTAKSALIRQFAAAVRGTLLRIPADPVLRAQRGLRPDRPGPAPRGDRRHGHHRHAPRGGIHLPRRAVQRQQRDPEQPADRAQRADLPPRCRGRTGCRCYRCSRRRTTCPRTRRCAPCSTDSCCAATSRT